MKIAASVPDALRRAVEEALPRAAEGALSRRRVEEPSRHDEAPAAGAEPDGRVRFLAVAGDHLPPLEGPESNDGGPHAWWGGNPSLAWHWAVDGKLDSLTTFPTAGWPAGLADRDGRWIVPLVSPLVLAFNHEAVSRARAPRDWIDLLHPRWRDRLIIPDPKSSSGRAWVLGAMLHELRRTGVEDAGVDWLLRFDAQTSRYATGDAEILRALRSGQADFAILPLYEVVAAAQDGSWLAWRVMESGGPLMAPPMGCLRGCTGGEAAALSLLLTRPVADAAASQGWVAPTEERALPQSLKVGTSFRDLGAWLPAPDTVAERGDAWLDRWEREVRGRGRTRF
ncbi:MAG: ABC transporter substrate-binding protein [Gemmatimonadota bacterium]